MLEMILMQMNERVQRTAAPRLEAPAAPETNEKTSKKEIGSHEV